MLTRHFFRWFWTMLAVVCLTVPFFANKAAANKAAAQPQGATGNVKTAGGLTVVTFTVNAGAIKVNLPDDMRAGDTISGTVIAEPNGTTKEERGANQTELKKFGIKLFTRDEDKPDDVSIGDVTAVFKFALTNNRESGNVFSVGLVVGIPSNIVSKASVPVFPLTPSGAVITPDPKITPPGAIITPDPKITPPGAVITPDPKITPPGAIITPDPKITPLGAVITPDPKMTPTFIIPPLGQTGRPIVITGSFDGSSENTKLTISGQPATPLAESPRKAVFDVPSNVTGPIELHLTEGRTQTTGNYRNVRIDLTAPKTSLLKGEKTELRVEVSGLEGLTAPVPLTLESHGVITMDGGMYQPMVIQPSQVGADGRYTTTRGITGVQTGGWEAIATVVTTRFNVCLQDDTSPHRRLLWNTSTGEYVFTYPDWWPPKGTGGTTGESGGGKTGGAKTGGETGGTIQPADPNPPPGGLTGKGKMIMKGCIITLEHNAPDRRVFSKLDSCTTSGTSTVEYPKTKTKFTITDRNIADNNTCQ
jgi:hypothetical protein